MVLTLKKTHIYIRNHYGEWFPHLPSYPGWNKRLRFILDAFPDLVEYTVQHLYHNVGGQFSGYDLLDSLPIKLARGSRSDTAKTAASLANKGYCDSQREWYYGIKFHLQAGARTGKLPVPKHYGVTPASTHDLTAWRDSMLIQENRVIYADKAYIDLSLQQHLEGWNRVSLKTPHKKKKGHPPLCLFQQVDNTIHSKIRQPIDALFSWMQEKTGIQNASKVRSLSGLLLHVYAKLAACMIIMLAFNC